MIYRPYGDYNISVLGLEVFGFEYLTKKTDSKSYLKAVESSLEIGVNYFEFGFPSLCRDGKLLKTIGLLIKDKSIVTVLRGNLNNVKDGKAFRKRILDDLKSLQLQEVTYIQLYGMNRSSFVKSRENGVLEEAKKLVNEGVAKGLTIFFTDDRFYLKPILEENVFASIAMEYSIMEVPRNPGTLKTAKDFGLNTIVHGTLKSGRISCEVPDNVKEIWNKYPLRSSEEWILDLALNTDGISSVLVEAFNPKRVKEFNSIVNRWAIDSAYGQSHLIGKQIRDVYSKHRVIQCELCRSCMPCPLAIDAPRIAELYNEYKMYGNTDIPSLQYVLEGHIGNECIKCGRCTKKCPREFPIASIITEAHKIFQKI